MDLTDLVCPAESDGESDEFDRRLRDIEVKYREVEKEVFTLDKVQSEAYSIECARLCIQLQEFGVERLSEGSDEEEEEGEDEEGEEDEEDEEEKYLEEKLVRKVHGEKCLGCEEVAQLDAWHEANGCPGGCQHE